MQGGVKVFYHVLICKELKGVIIFFRFLFFFPLLDVILYAFDTAWELHKPFFQKSGLLSEMVNEASQRPVVAESIPEEIVEEKQCKLEMKVFSVWL